MDIKNLRFRFYQSPIERIFSAIRSSAFPRIEVSKRIAEDLENHLNVAVNYCTFFWDSNQPALYRARKNDYDQLKKFPPSKMGPPDANIASAGRAQPAGVAVLYVANTAEAAIAEVRPEVGEYVTTGTFRIKIGKRLKVLDLTKFHVNASSYSDGELLSLDNISRRAFSASVHPGNPSRYYAHAYFVQMLRDLSYDGIGYKSAVSSGRCYAFFDVNNFKCTRTSLYQVDSVSVMAAKVDFSSAEKNHIARRDKEKNRVK